MGKFNHRRYVFTNFVKLFVTGDNGRIEYELSDETKDGDFGIDAQNGTIFTRRTLDRETTAYYNLIIVARDKAKPPQSALSASVQVIV